MDEEVDEDRVEVTILSSVEVGVGGTVDVDLVVVDVTLVEGGLGVPAWKVSMID